MKRQTVEESIAPKIRVVFMGTPAFAESVLAALIDNTYNVISVYTRPDKAIGRKKEIQVSPVKQLALQNNIPVEQPETFDATVIETLTALKPDLIIVAAYGKILPRSVLDIPGFGCINVHPSLLPKFRGPSPIQNALLSGEQETGTTIMLMDAGMDSGDILAQETIAIDADDTCIGLSVKLSKASNALLMKTLPLWIERKVLPQKQDASQSTLCQLIEREDGHIIWIHDASSIYNTFRALTPWPGIHSFWNRDKEQLLRLKLILITHQKHSPQTTHKIGEVFELGEKIGVQCMQGVIFLEEVQLEGKTAVSIDDFIKGYPQFIGSILQ